MVKGLAAQEAGAGNDQAKGIGREEQKRQQDDCSERWHERQRKGARRIKASVAKEVKLHRQAALSAVVPVCAPGEGAHDAEGEQAQEREHLSSFCRNRRPTRLRL